MGLFDFLKKKAAVETEGGIITLPFFGELNINDLEEYYEVSVKVDDRQIELDLNFENTTVRRKTIEKVRFALENLDSIFSKAKEYIQTDFQTGSEVNEYLTFHEEELDQNELAELLKDTDERLLQKERLLSIIRLNRIGIYPEDEEEFLVFDFVTNLEFSQYLLVVKTDEKGRLEIITTES